MATPPTHARVIDEIRAIHRRVRGQLSEAVGVFPAGAFYSAEDPALVLWVHATLLESVLLAYDALVEPIGDRRPGRVLPRRRPVVAIELGARPADVPLDWRALERYLRLYRQSGAIVVGADARAVATVLLRGRFSTLMGPVAWANRMLTAGWLPPDVRAQYGFEWNDARERQFRSYRRDGCGACDRFCRARSRCGRKRGRAEGRGQRAEGRREAGAKGRGRRASGKPAYGHAADTFSVRQDRRPTPRLRQDRA